MGLAESNTQDTCHLSKLLVIEVVSTAVHSGLLCSTFGGRRQYFSRTSPALCIALAPAPLGVSSGSVDSI